MKFIKIGYLCYAVSAMVAFASCSDTDEPMPEVEPDSEYTDNVASERLNANIAVLKVVAASTESEEAYLAQFPSLISTNVTVGQTFVFTDGTVCKVYKQVPEDSPAVSIARGEGGAFVWMVNGVAATTASGEPVLAASSPTPQLRRAGQDWTITYDNGATWRTAAPSVEPNLGVAVIDSDQHYAHMRMPDGTVLKLLRHEFKEEISSKTFSIAGSPVKSVSESGIVTVQLPYGTNLKQLKPEWLLPDGCYLTCYGVKQQSGSSPQDFSMPVDYTLVKSNGDKVDYTVAICFSSMPMLYIDASGTPINSRDVYVEKLKLTVCNTPNTEHDARYEKAKIKGRGNTSWGMPKKSYTLKLDKKDEFMGLKKHKTFALIGNYADKTLMRNAWAYQMGRDIYNHMHWSPTSMPVHLVIDGEYLGVFGLTESLKIDKNRVNVPNIEDCTSPADVEKYGFLVEIDNRAADESFIYSTGRNTFQLKDPDGADIPDFAKEFIARKLQETEDALYSNEWQKKDSPKYYGNVIDVDSYIDWFLVNELCKNCDATFYTSVYMYYDPSDGKMHMGPLWDFDIASGNINYNGCDDPTGFWIRNSGWYKRLFENRNFSDATRARYAETRPLLENFLSVTIYDAAKQLEPDAVINFMRWPILGKYVWPNADGYEHRTTFMQEVDYYSQWMEDRMYWFDKKQINL